MSTAFKNPFTALSPLALVTCGIVFGVGGALLGATKMVAIYADSTRAGG
ncbi:MAG: hypothetical protein HYX43_15750 [Burkholderiales bacterium]|nr:hypothetical protein [Burkholderiales bacterium]